MDFTQVVFTLRIRILFGVWKVFTGQKERCFRHSKFVVAQVLLAKLRSIETRWNQAEQVYRQSISHFCNYQYRLMWRICLNLSQHLLPYLLSPSWQPSRPDFVQGYHPKKPKETPKAAPWRWRRPSAHWYFDRGTCPGRFRGKDGMPWSTCQRIWSLDGVDGVLPLRDTPEMWGRLINDIQITTGDDRKWGHLMTHNPWEDDQMAIFA